MFSGLTQSITEKHFFSWSNDVKNDVKIDVRKAFVYKAQSGFGRGYIQLIPCIIPLLFLKIAIKADNALRRIGKTSQQKLRLRWDYKADFMLF